MTRLVIDASVAVKWFVPQSGEAHTAQALALLDGVSRSILMVVQPPHWLAETAAVLARVSPHTAAEDIADLHRLEVPVAHSLDIYVTACELAQRLDHHLFDTLYHAVALHTPDGALITADDRYYKKAQTVGRIVRLVDWEVA